MTTDTTPGGAQDAGLFSTDVASVPPGQTPPNAAPDAPTTVPASEAVTVEQRDAIAFRMASEGRTMREIGSALGVSHTTASRGVKREAQRRAEMAGEPERAAQDRERLRATLFRAMGALWQASRAPEASPRTQVAALRGVGALATRAARLLGLQGADVILRPEPQGMTATRLTINPETGQVTYEQADLS